MPPMCLVPHCATGSRTVNEKHPMFSIPKDENLRRKWEKVIPGNLKLRYGQVVCAKHFSEDQVITEIELKDKYGNVLNKCAYKRPRLKENAVPSIFEMPISVEENNDCLDSVEHNYSMNCSESSNCSMDRERQDDNFGEIRGALGKSTFDTDLLKIVSKKYSRESVKRKQNTINDNDLLNVITKKKSKVSDLNSLLNRSNSTKCDSVKDTLKENNEHNNSLQVSYRSIICINNEEIEIPKSWSIVQKNIKNQLTLIFTHSVSIPHNVSENKDKIKKLVTYNCLNGNAHYFAHGKEVAGVYDNDLLPRLCSAKLLVKTLLKFEQMKMCEGLKKEYISRAIVGEYYKDKFNSWRTKECTLLTRKFKKCEYCIKLMRKLSERGSGLRHTVPVGRKSQVNDEEDEKITGTSFGDEYIQELNNQMCSNNKIEKSIVNDLCTPITYKFLFKIEK